MIQQVFVSVGFMSLQFLINGFGTDCMAAYTAASKVDAFAEMPALNLGQAMTNLLPRIRGKKERQGIERREIRIGYGDCSISVYFCCHCIVSVCIYINIQ